MSDASHGDRSEPWEMTADEFVGPYLVGPIFSIDGNDDSYDYVRDGTAHSRPEVQADAASRLIRHLQDWDMQPSLVLIRHKDISSNGCSRVLSIWGSALGG